MSGEDFVMDVIERGARVLAAWDGRERAFDNDREGVRDHYRRRAEGVLNACAIRQGAVDALRDVVAAYDTSSVRSHAADAMRKIAADYLDSGGGSTLDGQTVQDDL